MIAGILLAAGSSTRFGGNKLAFELARGQAIGVQSARRLADAVDRVIVVVRPHDALTTDMFEAAGFTTVDCTDAARGMGHSLACGVAATDDAGGWLIGLADMPFVTAAAVRLVAATLRARGGIVVPCCNGRSGHPVGFDVSWRGALRGLTGDRGARALIEHNPRAVHRLETGDPGVLRDVDAPGDLSGD